MPQMLAMSGARRTAAEPPQGTWVTWETIEHYVEGPDVATEQPRGTHPPIVTVSAASGRPREAIEQAVSVALDPRARPRAGQRLPRVLESSD